MTFETALERFGEAKRQLAALSRAGAILEHDAMTAAPANSAAGRAETAALLAGRAYRIRQSLSETLETLTANAERLDPVVRREAELEKRALDRMRGVPEEAETDFRRAVGEASSVWRRAKAASDHKLFAPYLDRVFSAAAEISRAADPNAHPLDRWLALNEEGASTAMLDPFFGTVKEKLVPLIRAVGEKPKPDDGFLHGFFPKEKQKAVSAAAMDFLGIDRDSCVLGEAEHPYTTFISCRDVRMTTHYYEDRLCANMFSVLHEGGHATYELNIPPALDGSPAGHGASAGMHESQSRFFENMIGRSEAFAEFFLPKLRAIFPAQLENVTPAAFYRAVNRVEPGFKRTEADELTYCLHVLVRYELEKLMITGRLKAADLPEAWNGLYRELLGVNVPDDRAGCLQDMHWGSGLIGYFPSYALGNAYAAQIYAVLKKEIDVPAAVRAGDIRPIVAYLAERIYRFGSMKSPAELIFSCCGEDPDPRHYTAYLTEKYSALYGL